jgi:hypothetical protein
VIYGGLFGKTRTGNDYSYFKRRYSKIPLEVTVRKIITWKQVSNKGLPNSKEDF